jgi:hypothetical protein
MTWDRYVNVIAFPSKIFCQDGHGFPAWLRNPLILPGMRVSLFL